jgi:hypothetical protein
MPHTFGSYTVISIQGLAPSELDGKHTDIATDKALLFCTLAGLGRSVGMLAHNFLPSQASAPARGAAIMPVGLKMCVGGLGGGRSGA